MVGDGSERERDGTMRAGAEAGEDNEEVNGDMATIRRFRCCGYARLAPPRNLDNITSFRMGTISSTRIVLTLLSCTAQNLFHHSIRGLELGLKCTERGGRDTRRERKMHVVFDRGATRRLELDNYHYHRDTPLLCSSLLL